MTDLAMAEPASALSIDPASIQIPGLPSLQEILLLDALGRMPDESILEPALAALYLRVSEQTLARLRSEGGGSDYSQPKEGGRNAKVSYLMGELRRWHRSGKVSSTMEAAKSRGLCFASLMDLATPQPFWQSAAGQLDSPPLLSSASRFDEKSAVVADLHEELLLVAGAWRRGRRHRLLHLIHGLHHHEDGERHDEEVDDHRDERAVTSRKLRRPLVSPPPRRHPSPPPHRVGSPTSAP